MKLTDGNNVALTKFVVLDRGYTGHEHLLGVGLVHMNGRLYDPMLHRFLMPDNFVQDPYSSLSYNRYSYAMNNPLMYVDYNGEFVTESIGTAYLLWIGLTAISSAILTWGDEIKNAQYGRWLNTNFGKPVEKWVNKHIVKPFNNLFGGDKRPAPEVYMASMPMNAGSGGPNNLPIFGTSSAGSLGIPGGDLLRTGADFVPFVGSGLDIYEGIRDGDGWQVAMGAGFLVLDVATLGSSSLVKGAVKTGVKAGGRSLAKGAAKGGLQYSDDLVRAAQQTYPKLAGKTQLHHITPKYLGGAKNGPLVPLDGAYHQMITNEFRALWGYGKGVPSATELQSIMKQVYSKYPLPPGYGF